METVSIIFIGAATLNIVVLIYKWIVIKDNQFSAICGWLTAITYCILYNSLK